MQKLFILVSLLIVPVISVYGQVGGEPTLRVVTEDPSLPSELFYGNTKVKPLRLRPGTTTPITIHDSDFFVQQQYLDFLNRFPDAGGFAYWTGRLNTCAGDDNCSMVEERIRVAAGFFYSNEFLLRKGYFVYRFYSASLGRRPKYAEMIPDMRLMGKTDAEEEAKRVEFINLWMQRPEFKSKYDGLSDSAFVSRLITTAGVTLDPSQFAGKTRAQILRMVVESVPVYNKYFREAFVSMQYFGFLRRDPDPVGFPYWMGRLNQYPDDHRLEQHPEVIAPMVGGFIYSDEYQKVRF
ncbi:MAG TPA: DUF4214 domain-containing protein [Pyrinomonadaceae bacterium]|nr:DUF4214 domain-containing protein [Pyrinomonadaceae bacterium]